MTIHLRGVLSFCLLAIPAVYASFDPDHERRASDDGYVGYKLEQRGDPESAIYQTAETNTDPGDVLPSDPDVSLNASVSVAEIDIEVDNITAKVNLQADVLNLLHFSAGVDASIDSVLLTIQNISAEVYLEARLENVVQMISDVLDSIDLNPIIATLGEDVGKIVNTTVGTIESPFPGTNSTTAARKRGLDIRQNVLYSINDYSGNTHTNRVLGQDGNIYDIKLNNDGDESSRSVVGSYAKEMQFTGHNHTITANGVVREFELEYSYNPLPGVQSICMIIVNTAGRVIRTQIIAEGFGGGSSTISDDTGPPV